MSPSEYLEKRLNNQIDWYDQKSVNSQKYYKRLQATGIILAGLIPFLAGYAHKHWVIQALISLFGTIIVISSAFSKLGAYHEKWLEYRQTCEILRHEKYLFLTGAHPYEDKSFHLLVQRVESIISAENVNWSQIATSSKDKN